MSHLDCKILVCIYRKLCSNSVQMFFLWVLFTKEILLEAIFKVVTKLPPWMPMCQNSVKTVPKVGKWEKWVTKARDRARSRVCGDSCSKLSLFHFNSISLIPRNTVGLKMGSSSKTGKTGSSVTGLRGRSRVCGDSCSSLINTRYYRAQRAISGFSRANR